MEFTWQWFSILALIIVISNFFLMHLPSLHLKEFWSNWFDKHSEHPYVLKLSSYVSNMHILSIINSSFLTLLEVQSSVSIQKRLALGPTPDTKIHGYSSPRGGHMYLLLLIYSSTYHETCSTVCIYWGKKSVYKWTPAVQTCIDKGQLYSVWCGIMTSSFVNTLNSPSLWATKLFNHNRALTSVFQLF